VFNRVDMHVRLGYHLRLQVIVGSHLLHLRLHEPPSPKFKRYLRNPPGLSSRQSTILSIPFNIMSKGLEKTRKKISKKKGNITVLHENSRDSQRLRRAGMRDFKLEKVASSRRKNDQPLSGLRKSKPPSAKTNIT
jgi:hypothetical protein